MDEERKRPQTIVDTSTGEGEDAEFGGHEARKILERRLLRKIDLRMSMLVVAYILNYARVSLKCSMVMRSQSSTG